MQIRGLILAVVALALAFPTSAATEITADYVVWHDQFGSTANLSADGDGKRVIDVGDDDVWRAHFGQSAESGEALPSAETLSAAVPEPAIALLLTGLTAMTLNLALLQRPRVPNR